MKVAITGAYGLIGTHVSCHLKAQNVFEIVRIGRKEFEDPELLKQALAGCQAVVHLAGQNRGPEQEVFSCNVSLTEKLAHASAATPSLKHILFSSSAQIESDTVYGQSKIKAAQILERWASENQGVFSNFVLPHIFGEGGRPFYNSVVSTFCHQLAEGTQPQILKDSMLELVHAGEVAKEFMESLKNPKSFEKRIQGTKKSVSELLKTLEGIRDNYRNQIVPDLNSLLTLQLFNTYRSYLLSQKFSHFPTKHTDNRGVLFEVFKGLSGGQAFVSTTKPGITRGNHYHLQKFERFCVLQGKALIRLRKLFSSASTDITVDGDSPCLVDIPTLHTHNISNIGTEPLVTLFWSHEFFNPEKSDTFPEIV